MKLFYGVRRFSSSLHIRLLFLLFAVGIVPALFLTAAFLEFYEVRMIDNDVIRITSQAQVLNNVIVSGGFLSGKSKETINGELSTLSNSYSGRIMVMDEGLKVVKDTYGMYDGRTLIWEQAIRALSNTTEHTYDKLNGYLIVTIPIVSNDEPDMVRGVLLITKSMDDIARNMEFFWSLAIICDLLIMTFVAAAAISVSAHATKPFKRLAKGISDIRKGIKHDPLNVDDFAETKEISESFCELYDQMKVMDDSRAEFVSNVSHELKTPLTSMKVLADSINMMGDEVPIEMYREFMTDITGEIDHETQIINELLSLVRLDRIKGEPDISPININELLEILMKRLQPIAQNANVELVLESFRPVTAEVDEIQLSLALMNLIENAIKYNKEGGWVHVSLNSDHQYCYIRVEDNGIGIPEDSLDRVFERFYRADKSHSRQIAGTGLGLSITYDAIVLHHGDIKVHSALDEGTTFDVRLPLKYIKEPV